MRREEELACPRTIARGAAALEVEEAEVRAAGPVAAVARLLVKRRGAALVFRDAAAVLVERAEVEASVKLAAVRDVPAPVELARLRDVAGDALSMLERDAEVCAAGRVSTVARLPEELHAARAGSASILFARGRASAPRLVHPAKTPASHAAR